MFICLPDMKSRRHDIYCIQLLLREAPYCPFPCLPPSIQSSLKSVRLAAPPSSLCPSNRMTIWLSITHSFFRRLSSLLVHQILDLWGSVVSSCVSCLMCLSVCLSVCLCLFVCLILSRHPVNPSSCLFQVVSSLSLSLRSHELLSHTHLLTFEFLAILRHHHPSAHNE